ncbi:disease resistance protein Pik-1-like [Zingiber officinale]|uniref:disease resistance protein Pik-1-like n=1 Tax=Zingiber officinale TaxID=94328 RepID=UPI001C4ACC9A|nr:disease resistance protein Pik-1-like [Zingiber officinale]
MVQQKMVMKLTMEDPKKKAKALKTAVGVHGVISVALEDDKIVVVGDVDSVDLTRILRKKMGHVDLVSVAENKKEEKKEEKKGAEPVAVTWPNYGPFMQQYPIMIQEDPYYREPTGCIIM